MTKRRNKVLILIAISVVVATFFTLDLHHYLTLEQLKARQQDIQEFYGFNRLLTLILYFTLYVLVAALSLPGATVLTLAGGALFGFFPALVTVSFASAGGAVLAFLGSRLLLRDWVLSRFGERLGTINRGLEKEGALYLLTLRLVPLFPFFVINLAMGLTTMRTLTFYWISQIGMLAGTAIYINAGTRLGQIDSLAGLFSPGLLVSFFLLGTFPLLARQLIGVIRKRKAFRADPNFPAAACEEPGRPIC